MRYVRLFFLNFQSVFQYRSRAFVWFLISLLNPVLVLVFWLSAYASGVTLEHWSSQSITAYYLFLIIGGSLLMAHVEEEVAVNDIQQGGLVKYLVKPFPYALFKFFEELPWRLLQGFFGLAILVFLNFWLKSLPMSFDLLKLLCILVTVCFGYAISYFFKMIIGISAFWLTDFRGLQQLVEVITIIFGGFVMPLDLFPPLLKTIAFASPLPYIVYVPIIIFQGKVDTLETAHYLLQQGMWVCFLGLLYIFLWKKGLSIFTGVGQ